MEFLQSHQYADDPHGIPVPVTLRHGDRSVLFLAKVDTGAQYCVFQRQWGERLGLAIESGEPLTFGVATGDHFVAYGFELEFEVLGLKYLSVVYFAGPAGFARSVLGRNGWLSKSRLGLVDYDRTLLLSPYDS